VSRLSGLGVDGEPPRGAARGDGGVEGGLGEHGLKHRVGLGGGGDGLRRVEAVCQLVEFQLHEERLELVLVPAAVPQALEVEGHGHVVFRPTSCTTAARWPRRCWRYSWVLPFTLSTF
jgi:hypothetical protein